MRAGGRLVWAVSGTAALLSPASGFAQSSPPPHAAADWVLTDELLFHDPATGIPLPDPAAVAPAPATRPTAFAVPTWRSADLPGWSANQVSRPMGGGAVDSLRISSDTLINLADGATARAYDINYTRGWPSAWSIQAAGYSLDITPHAGIGMSSLGRSAEAGATFKVGDAKSALAERLEALGVQTERPYGGPGHWYLFAAVRGRALDTNTQGVAPGNAAQGGWVTAPTPTLLSDGQVGLGWSKGAMDASVGYVQRQTKVINAPVGVSDGMNESVVALSFTFRPH